MSMIGRRGIAYPAAYPQELLQDPLFSLYCNKEENNPGRKQIHVQLKDV